MTRSSTHPLLVNRPSLHLTRTETSVLDFCVDLQCARRPLLDTPVSTAVTGTWTAVLIGCSLTKRPIRDLDDADPLEPSADGRGTDGRCVQKGTARRVEGTETASNIKSRGRAILFQYMPLGMVSTSSCPKSHAGHGTKTPITASTGGQRASSRLRFGAKGRLDPTSPTSLLFHSPSKNGRIHWYNIPIGRSDHSRPSPNRRLSSSERQSSVAGCQARPTAQILDLVDTPDL